MTRGTIVFIGDADDMSIIIDDLAKVYGLKIMNKSLNRGGHHLNTVSGEVRIKTIADW